MELDIEKLHRVIETKVRGRQVGTTTAILVQAIQSAEVHTNVRPGIFLMYSLNHLQADFQLQYAIEIARDMGLDFSVDKRNRKLVFPGMFTNELWFVPGDTLRQRTAAISVVNYFVDSWHPLTDAERYTLESSLEKE